ncbi:vWA domain-containing protein [Pseudonocardia kongjuensis]|uniref:vWA domain-containing protein n=1 Tax=Pseudonocardia kongjuensis TaxID=102227 RepID=UPI003CD094E5
MDPLLAGRSAGGPVAALAGFTAVLRHAGLAVPTDRVAAFLQAVGHLGVTDRERAYRAGRVTLCSDPDDLPRYDIAFATWFDPAITARTAPPAATPPPARPAPLGSGRDPDADADGSAEVLEIAVAASATEVLRDRDIAELTRAEREHLRVLLARLRPDPPLRRSRRLSPARHGGADPRRTLRAAMRAGGELRALHRRDQERRPRRVVLLIDVSGSMQPYADALLRFAHVVARRSPASTEVFTLGTRLTRVSRELRLRDPEHALRAADAAIVDRSGGTRLGEVLRTFVDVWGRRGTARGAAVVVFSDGWERGTAELLGEQAGRLARLAHRLVWVNPHAGKDGYLPVQGGIVAALPHLDELLAGHSLATLEELLAVLRRR